MRLDEKTKEMEMEDGDGYGGGHGVVEGERISILIPWNGTRYEEAEREGRLK
jgi:hypothetical protein